MRSPILFAVFATFFSVSSAASIPQREYDIVARDVDEMLELLKREEFGGRLFRRTHTLNCDALAPKWGEFGHDVCHENYECSPAGRMVVKAGKTPNNNMGNLCAKCHCEPPATSKQPAGSKQPAKSDHPVAAKQPAPIKARDVDELLESFKRDESGGRLFRRTHTLNCDALAPKWGEFGHDVCHENYECSPAGRMVVKAGKTPNNNMGNLCAKCHCEPPATSKQPAGSKQPAKSDHPVAAKQPAPIKARDVDALLEFFKRGEFGGRLFRRTHTLNCDALAPKWGDFGHDVCHENYECSPAGRMVVKAGKTPNDRMGNLCAACHCQAPAPAPVPAKQPATSGHAAASKKPVAAHK